jgi:hypothetical protein
LRCSPMWLESVLLGGGPGKDSTVVDGESDVRVRDSEASAFEVVGRNNVDLEDTDGSIYGEVSASELDGQTRRTNGCSA